MINGSEADGCQMLMPLPSNTKNRRPGRAPLRAAPTTLGSEMQQKIRETGLSKNPSLYPLYPTSAPNAVGASPRPAHPGLRVYKFKTTLVSQIQREITETGLSQTPFL